jgi:hypothetical protein
MRARFALVMTAVLLVGCVARVPAPATAPVVGSASPAPDRDSTPIHDTAPAWSPAASPSASPTAPAAPSTGRARWPYITDWEIRDVLFGRHGEVYVVETSEAPSDDGSEAEAGLERSRIVGLAADGSPLDGWPWSPFGSGGGIIAGVGLRQDGSVEVLVEHEQATADLMADVAPDLTLFRISGSDGARSRSLGLSAGDFCGLAPGTLNMAYVVCEGDVTAVNLSQMSVAWRVRVPGSVAWSGVRPDGALVVLAGDSRMRMALLPAVLAAPRVTWRRLAGSAWDASFTLDPEGTLWQRIVRQPYEECSGPLARTTYRALTSKGRTGTGWPVRLGWASDPPLVGNDGTLYVTTGAGSAVAYSAGRRVPGWPVRSLDVAAGCWTPAPPASAGSDGIVVTGDTHVTLVTRDGRVARGWPVKLPYPLAIAAPGNTPGPGIPIAPVVGSRGIYLAAYSRRSDGGYPGSRPRIIAIDRGGHLPTSWQRTFGNAGDEILGLQIQPGGHVWAITDSGVFPVGSDEPLSDRQDRSPRGSSPE